MTIHVQSEGNCGVTEVFGNRFDVIAIFNADGGEGMADQKTGGTQESPAPGAGPGFS